MKKNYVVSAILIPAVILTGCDKPVHEFAIKVTMSPTEDLIALTAAGVYQMVQTKQTFPLLLYSDTCVHCEVAQSLITNYRKTNPVTIYKVNAREIDKLTNLMPEYFQGDIYAPNLYIFDKGSLTYTFGSDKLTHNADFVAEANAVFQTSNVDFYTEDFNIQNIVSAHPNTLVFVGDLEDEVALNFYQEHFFDLAINSNKYSVVLDYNEENKNFIPADQYKIFVYENSKEKERFDYGTDSLSCINFLNSYYLQ